MEAEVALTVVAVVKIPAQVVAKGLAKEVVDLHVKGAVKEGVLRPAPAHVTPPVLAHAVRLATQHVLQPVWGVRGHVWVVVKGLVCIPVICHARQHVSA